MLKAISTLILKIIGWKITGVFDHGVKKVVTIALPHTSNWDFPLGILSRWYSNQKIGFVIKNSWLKIPIVGWIMKNLGATGVNRKKKTKLVDNIADTYNESEEINICFAPEGTRKKVESLKTGFYHVAKQANVPIIMVKFDYVNKVIDFGAPFYPTEDQDADMAYIESYFKGVIGKVPEYSYGYENEK